MYYTSLFRNTKSNIVLSKGKYLTSIRINKSTFHFSKKKVQQKKLITVSEGKELRKKKRGKKKREKKKIWKRKDEKEKRVKKISVLGSFREKVLILIAKDCDKWSKSVGIQIVQSDSQLF